MFVIQGEARYPDFDGSQLCAQGDPEAWFPNGPLDSNNRLAIKTCKVCHFQQECQTYALYNLIDGIWGGLTAQDRRRIRRERQIQARPVVLFLSESADAVRARERRANRREMEETP